jgi:hypothetical protein
MTHFDGLPVNGQSWPRVTLVWGYSLGTSRVELGSPHPNPEQRVLHHEAATVSDQPPDLT